MIITIDGPAGAGKSSVARGLARRLGFDYLDTGAMYRCVALAGLRSQVDWENPASLAELARRITVRFRGEQVWLEGDNVTTEIRSPEVTQLVYYAANNGAVREQLVELQRSTAAGRDLVTEGRDQGTIAFPDAECKIFLTASPEERARRRFLELQARGESTSFDDVLAQQNLRDIRDSNREWGALRAADDAVEVSSDGLTPEEVIDRLEKIAVASRHA